MFVTTAYFVRGMLFLIGTTKKALTERAEELAPNESESIPLAEGDREESETEIHGSRGSELFGASTTSGFLDHPYTEAVDGVQMPLRAQDPDQITGTGGPPEGQTYTKAAPRSILRHNAIPLTRAQRWTIWLESKIDILTYLFILGPIGVPLYFLTGYAAPIQLSLNVLAYFSAIALPSRWKRILHPVIVASLFTVLGIWVLAVAKGEGLKGGLRQYQVKVKYVQLLRGERNAKIPGAGDFFGSLLDVGIVGLALPMWMYRGELKRNVSYHHPLQYSATLQFSNP
jgi:hypothetical protein